MIQKTQNRLKKASKAMLKFDRFGSTIASSSKKKESHNTRVGAMASMGIQIFVIVSLVNLLYDMFFTENPNVVQNLSHDPNPKEYKLLPNKYIFGVSVEDIHGNPIKQSERATIYQAQAKYCSKYLISKNGSKYEFTTNCTIFNLVPCNSASVDPKLIKSLQFDPKQLKYYQCIDTKEWAMANLAYQGTPSSKQFKTMNFRISPCVTGRIKNQVCAKNSTIHKNLRDAQAVLLMPNYLLDQKNGGNPYTPSYKKIITLMTNTRLTLMEIFLQPSNTSTIKNLFYYFGNSQNFNQLVYNRQNQYFQSLSADGVLASFTIFLDEQRVDFYRTYNDIFFVLANIGGLTNSLVLLGSYLFKPLSKLSLDLSLVNKIYTIEDDKKNKNILLRKLEDERDKQHELKKGKSIAFLQKYEPSQLVQRKVFPEIDDNVAYLKQLFKQKILKTSFFEFAFQWLPGQGQKAKLIKTGVEKIYEKLDSLYILKKLIEVDKLKALLLNEQQIKLFEQLPKPKLTQKDLSENDEQDNNNFMMFKINNPFSQVTNRFTAPKTLDRLTGPKTPEAEAEGAKEEFDIFHSEKPFLEKFEGLFEAYQKVSEKPNELDQKLLNLLDKNILQIFDQVSTYRKSLIQSIVVIPDEPLKDSTEEESPIKQQQDELLEPIKQKQNGLLEPIKQKQNALLENQKRFEAEYQKKKNIDFTFSNPFTAK